ncbi:hypothetical protein C8039_05190 [Halogeometricum sp. wsp3]|nr:hypothetical protein C8039_05190 [Halogeometricum sp. wsp3]
MEGRSVSGDQFRAASIAIFASASTYFAQTHRTATAFCYVQKSLLDDVMDFLNRSASVEQSKFQLNIISEFHIAALGPPRSTFNSDATCTVGVNVAFSPPR